MKAVNGKFFPHGIRIPGRKELSSEQAIAPLPLPKEVAIPLKQHIGAPAEPLVKPGDRVLRGQPIGRAAGRVSAGVHASVSGVVTEVAERADGRGGKCLFAVITCDGEQENGFMPPLVSPSREEIRARICEAGIVGMGGAGFPAHVKSAPAG
ncbi:MAG: hypothetical protein ACI4ST_00085, partial [Candidatus Gallimonas sp.]